MPDLSYDQPTGSHSSWPRRQAIKIVLDVTRLVREGKLTPEQAEELKALASRDIGILAINILMSFGSIAVAAGILALSPTFATGAAIGFALVASGLAVSFGAGERWSLLGTASTVIGALLLSGGVIGALDAGFTGLAFTAILLLGLAVVIRNSLLMALVPLALAGALGSSTGYFHATYMLIVTEPTITIVFFALLALAAHLVGNRGWSAYEGLATVFARMSLVLVNFGFWVGSLWGDHAGESWAVGGMESWTAREAWEKAALHAVGGMESWTAREAWEKAALHVPGWVFTTAWAVLVIGVGIWAARANRRWVVTMAATFGAINFYTQWFERLGAEPWTIIVAGLTIVGIAVGLWRYNTAHAGGVPSLAAGA